MTDEKKFKTVTFCATLLVIIILSYNIFQERFSTGLVSYMKRRAYYENVISKSGLSLHEGKYWRKTEE